MTSSFKKDIIQIFFKIGWLLFTLSLCSCGQGFQSKSLSSLKESYFSSSDSKSFLRPGEQVRSDCQFNSELCIYLKNPVSQSGKLIGPEDRESLKGSQTFSTSINGLDRSGKVKNSNFDVKSVSGTQITVEQLALTKGVSDTDLIPLSANAFFWLNRAHEYLKNNFGTYPSLSVPISVYVDDAFSGWSYEQRSLHLDRAKKSALSGEIILLLFGEAQVGFASEGRIYKSDSSLHQACGEDPKGCCTSSKGCSQAILRGVGDTFVNLFFGDLSGVGEFQRQSLEGQMICGKPRKLEHFLNLSFQQAYDLCPSKKGSTLALGMAYASIWFEIRKEFDPLVVDKIFLNHLNQLNGSDTFESQSAKAQASANKLGFTNIAQKIGESFLRRSN